MTLTPTATIFIILEVTYLFSGYGDFFFLQNEEEKLKKKKKAQDLVAIKTR